MVYSRYDRNSGHLSSFPSKTVSCSLTIMACDMSSTFRCTSGDTNRNQWAAFDSDCIHEIKPVHEGHRVTVTDNIITSECSPSYRQSTRSRHKLEDPVTSV